MKFGDYIRQKREDHGLTQPEAAARANIEQSYLSKLETGKSYPSEDVFDKLITAYSINVKEMGNAVQLDELEKLKDIAKVRAYVLKERRSKRAMTRAWLIAALVFMTVGGGLTFYQAAKEDREVVEYIYQSSGLLKPNEDRIFFDTVGYPGNPPLTPEVASRMIPKVKRLKEDPKSDLVETEGDYIRIYEFRGEDVTIIHQRDMFLMAVGVSFLICSFGCFIIGFRWN